MSEKQNIKFYIRDDGIIVFQFLAMHRQAADDFGRIIKASMKNVPDKLRVLYDFSQSPPPTRYFLQIQGELYDSFPHPEDERTAYVTGTSNNEVWVRIARTYFTAKDTMRVFVNEDEAIAWLLG